MQDKTPDTPLSEEALRAAWENIYTFQPMRFQARGWRTLRGWSQKMMAEKLGIAMGTIGRVENGHSVNQRTARAYLKHTGIKLWEDSP